ncbi:MAG: hypothetical protein ACO312_05755 [Candidatus Nanopelagicaceae bacterium]|jgi:hypothetical protein
MGDEFHAAIKLVSGEEIFALISVDENDGDPILLLQNPVVMKVLESPHGTYVKVKPWMDIPSDDMFVLKLDKIITMSEVNDKKVISFYEKYLRDDEDDLNDFMEPNKVNISSKMGYLSSVDDARERLEKIFKGIKES